MATYGKITFQWSYAKVFLNYLDGFNYHVPYTHKRMFNTKVIDSAKIVNNETS